jgi:hypothetical protein
MAPGPWRRKRLSPTLSFLVHGVFVLLELQDTAAGSSDGAPTKPVRASLDPGSALSSSERIGKIWRCPPLQADATRKLPSVSRESRNTLDVRTAPSRGTRATCSQDGNGIAVSVIGAARRCRIVVRRSSASRRHSEHRQQGTT